LDHWLPLFCKPSTSLYSMTGCPCLQAAFYGGTALRILHGHDRYSEDMEFTLLTATPGFDLGGNCQALERELLAFGFQVSVQKREKAQSMPLDFAHLQERMWQSGHLATDNNLTEGLFREMLTERIESLNVVQTRSDFEPFVKISGALEVGSRLVVV